MSGSKILSVASNAAGLFADDAAIVGSKLIDGRPDRKKKRLPGLPVIRSAPGQVVKQENTMTTKTAAEIQADMDRELTKLLDGEPTQEAKATMLIKMGIFRDELVKMTPTLGRLDEETSEAAVLEWFKGGDTVLRKAVFNALAGSAEVEMLKIAPELPADLELAAYVEKGQTPELQNRALVKIAQYRTEYAAGMQALEKAAPEDRTAAIEVWVKGDDGSDADLKRAIAKSYDGHAAAIYGSGQAPENPVTQVVGNASTAATGALGGSAGSPDTGGRRLIPKAPGGEGAGRKMDGDNGPVGDGGAGKTTDTGSGPNDTGGGEVKPKSKIKRRGATGGLGNSAGADGPQAGQHADEDDGAHDQERAEKAEAMLGVLIKGMGDGWVEMLEPMDEDSRIDHMIGAVTMGSDLAAWVLDADPDKLEKGAFDAEIVAWLSEDPATIATKQFVAEALASAEQIPLELGKAIMAWRPPGSQPAVRLRRAAA